MIDFSSIGEPCDPEDTGKMHSCGNGRCISNDVLCRDLNPCADFSDACEESGIQQTPAKVILSTSKYIIIGVGAFVGLLCLAQGCFVVRRCCCSGAGDGADEEKSHVELVIRAIIRAIIRVRDKFSLSFLLIWRIDKVYSSFKVNG